MSKITEMKEAINNSDMNTETKAEINGFFHLFEKIYTRVPCIYYAGAVYGLVIAFYGIFSAILFGVICGIGVFLVALIAILEVICTRRKMET